MNTQLAPAPGTHVDASHAGWSNTVLDQLMARVGVDGLVAALRSPELQATVDEHVSQVRAALEERGVGVGASSLAAYGALVVAAALRRGRVLPADPGRVDWSAAEWYLIRLVAVCALAEESGCL